MSRYLALVVFLAVIGCDDNNNNAPVLQNNRRIECEKNVADCGGKDALRFYMMVPRIQLDTNNVTITEVWHSFIICCDSFTAVMDSLSVYAQLVDTAIKYGRSLDKRDTVGGVIITAGVSYYPEFALHRKRMEWINFGAGDYSWSMPTGEHFAEHRRELEEAYRRCCL